MPLDGPQADPELGGDARRWAGRARPGRRPPADARSARAGPPAVHPRRRSPWRRAAPTASARRTPQSTRATCAWTVCRLRCRADATSALLAPAATRRPTSASRELSPAKPLPATGGNRRPAALSSRAAARLAMPWPRRSASATIAPSARAASPTRGPRVLEPGPVEHDLALGVLDEAVRLSGARHRALAPGDRLVGPPGEQRHPAHDPWQPSSRDRRGEQRRRSGPPRPRQRRGRPRRRPGRPASRGPALGR